MLALKVIGTVFLALSCVFAFIKNVNIWCRYEDRYMFAVATVYGWLWRAFVIVALWII